MSFDFVMWGLTLQHRSKWRERNRSEEAKRSPLSPNFDLSEVDQKNSETTAIRGTIRNRNDHRSAKSQSMMKNAHINIPRGDYTVLDIKQIQEIIPHRPRFCWWTRF